MAAEASERAGEGSMAGVSNKGDMAGDTMAAVPGDKDPRPAGARISRGARIPGGARREATPRKSRRPRSIERRDHNKCFVEFRSHTLHVLRWVCAGHNTARCGLRAVPVPHRYRDRARFALILSNSSFGCLLGLVHGFISSLRFPPSCVLAGLPQTTHGDGSFLFWSVFVLLLQLYRLTTVGSTRWLWWYWWLVPRWWVVLPCGHLPVLSGDWLFMVGYGRVTSEPCVFLNWSGK